MRDYYQSVGFFRASGLSESQAHAKAEEEVTMGLNEWNLQNILESGLDLYFDGSDHTCKTTTYEEAGMLTNNKGLVITIDGHEFQVTIVKSKAAPSMSHTGGEGAKC